jgi:hypothetical protein
MHGPLNVKKVSYEVSTKLRDFTFQKPIHSSYSTCNFIFKQFYLLCCYQFYLIILFNLSVPTLLSPVGDPLSGNVCGSPNHI